MQQLAGPFYKKYAVALAPAACKHRVSGSLSLPSRGSFHLSLTVLCSIGHQVVFSLGGWSPRLPAGFLVSCGTPDTRRLTITSPTGLLPSPAGLSRPVRLSLFRFVRVHTPAVRGPPVWAPSRSLAATWEIDVSFFSSGYLDVSVHRVPPVTLCIHVTVTCFRMPGFPIRAPTDQGLLTAPRGFSQFAAPFFGSWCQGIHPALLLA